MHKNIAPLAPPDVVPSPPTPADSPPVPGSIPAQTNPELAAPHSALRASPGPQPSTLNPQPFFERCPGETPRAFGAFMTFFQLGHARSLQAVADKLGEGLPTVKNWSSKYDWSERLQAFNSGVLQQQALDQAARQRQEAADWASRLHRFRELEWDAAQKLIAAAQCFLESFGEDDLRRATLAQVSRALKISSAVGRQALAGVPLPESQAPALSPIQRQLMDAVNCIYGQTSAARDSSQVSAPQKSPGATN